MLSELTRGPKVVGAKQTKRVLADGHAATVFLAQDADPGITGPIETMCKEKSVALVSVLSMKDLGAACGIAVGAAVAALMRQ